MKNLKCTPLNPRYVEYKRQLKVMREYKHNLRTNATIAETKMKRILSILKVYYIFQKAFYSKGRLYIVDFYLPYKKLVIEIDGSHHQTDLRQIRYDVKRTEFLKTKRNLKVIRFANTDVLYNTDVVIRQLRTI